MEYTYTMKKSGLNKLSNLIIFFLILFFILLGGIFMRINAISVYKFYPDTYQSLQVAENIRNFGSVVAPLGKNGMLYPDYFSWTRPMFSLLIIFFDIIISNLEITARVITLSTSIISILIAYLYISSIFKSRLSGLLGTLLLTISFNHSVWSGFILSDTTGVLFLFITLWLMSRYIDNKNSLAHWQDLLTGLIFSFAILTRYEYVLFIIPMVYLFYAKSVNPFSRLLTITAATGFIISCVFFSLSPFLINFSSAISQISSFVDPINSFDFRGLRGFIISDYILFLFFIFGTICMFYRKELRHLIIFSLLSIIPLWFVYYQTNPVMQRYFIHLIPFMLLPASFGFTKFIQKILNSNKLVKYTTMSLCGFALLFQTYITYNGLHSTNDGIWFKAGYEAQVVELVHPYIPEDAVIIVSFPEPYYLGIKQSTHSISDSSPFIYIPNSLDEKEAIIIEDEGMRRIFPKFSAFLQKNGGQYAIKNIELQTEFRYGQTIDKIVKPIRLYSIKINNLKQLIDKI